MKNVLITGAASEDSLGNAIAYHLARSNSSGVRVYGPDQDEMDVTDPSSISEYLNKNEFKKIDFLINCAGINDIDWFENFNQERWQKVIETNASSIFYTTQACLPLMGRGSTICNIVSNASHIPMTNSAAYNASKGAAHILTQSMARELFKTHGITIFGVSPNKLSGTGMSKYIDKTVPGIRGWTEEQAREYQLSALPAGEETDPETLAEFIAFLLSTKQRHKYLNGCVIPYGA